MGACTKYKYEKEAKFAAAESYVTFAHAMLTLLPHSASAYPDYSKKKKNLTYF